MRGAARSMARSGWFTTALVGVMTVGVALPVQATGSRQSSRFTYEYPEKVVQAYVSACGNEATDRVPQPVMQAICVCTIEEFQNEFSLPEFRAIGQAIQEERDVPPEMNRIMSDCVRQVMVRPNV
ncbi:hypothetical protein IQ266_01495 [filamentous cyanobacterium LEGE 11480]|uniref:Uncharacterized protein n=1 Tax=Romeriopsis navalis LEGE 11480 TaxID=2777977 RepID=A0A928Z2R8_9CYAN|nr:hypothetical protein [Romeriopsis navalis]MBE9028428.1 hypothetical protein [Romeriopsis navalis LEGE 11480]